MKIVGIEKLSLVDYDGYTACTVFTPGCNLRCPFCQNAPLLCAVPPPPEIPEGEIFAHLERRRGLVDALCISGGEPTLFEDLPDFIARARQYGVRIKLDTNGTNPDMLAHLIKDGLLDYVAMDMKNSPEKYALTVGKDIDIQPILRSVDILRHSSIGYEFRTTVVKEFHTDADMHEIGKLTAFAPAFYLQQFRDRDTNLKVGLHAHTEETLQGFAAILRTYIPKVEIRGL